MPSKYDRERKQRRAELEERVDLVHNPRKSDSIAALCKELERAKKTLAGKMELGDDKAITKLREIIDNLNKTIERSK